MATPRFAHFKADITRARDLVGLGKGYEQITHGVVDSSDIYRASVVQAVASLDHYTHGVVLDRAVDILLGRLPQGATTRIGISFNAVQEILSAGTVAEQELRARTHIAQRLGLETFQKSDAIGNALAMVGVSKIWATAFPPPLTSPAIKLNLIVDRRNKIVHQGDSDPVNPGVPTPLFASDALDAVATIDQIVSAIDPLC